ncbi:polysaccharide deacetylase family protein [Neomoorella humiferrea]|uniref:Peptidoglycan-N-acetylmuramic acid deacetylase PdaC n=1 Tax=Neomoorella humiferrea TaxID=676965 RepID=A0A2T0AYT9_9FIRM|nr:polysaccharide deacetylase family protein [Moorella humiferrea]PRR76178.1 Peptidoglycan-N-acetylmuramic acid deacetylase PdaC [Moorella humiferrea]
MGQAGKIVEERWLRAEGVGRHARAVWAEVLLRLCYVITLAALMSVVATIAGASWYREDGVFPYVFMEALPETSPPGLSNGPEGLKPYPTETHPAERVEPSRPLRQVPNAGRRVALTFDDGPFPRWTERYLAVLAATKTPATFFLVGRQAQAFPQLVQAVLTGGHEVASHSWRHANLSKVPFKEAQADLRQAAFVLEEISGGQIKYFRPPYGALSDDLLTAATELKLKTVTWNIDPRDWSNPGPDAIVKNVMNNVRDGSIILLHEGHPGTLAALPLLVKRLREKGYELVTVSELMAAGGMEE